MPSEDVVSPNVGSGCVLRGLGAGRSSLSLNTTSALSFHAVDGLVALGLRLDGMLRGVFAVYSSSLYCQREIVVGVISGGSVGCVA